MAITLKTPSQVAEEYLTHLKAIKPSVNVDQEDSDFWIKGQTYGGVVSGVYSDISKVSDDAFPQSARRDAVEKHLETFLNDGFTQPTVSNGRALVSPDGATGTFVDIGEIEFLYEANGNTYVNTESFTIDAATGVPVNIQSIGKGQIQNLLEGALLTISSPPPGVSSSSEVFGGPLSDGRDVETTQEAAARVLARIREPIRGGTSEDYRQWALEADDSVVSANILRYPQGFGSVGIIIAAGTTDIDTALDNGDPIVLIPSQVLIDTVQAYIDSRRPLTDYALVYSPVETTQDVLIRVRYSQGDGTTILAGQTLTQEELVVREVKRAIYKTPAGGRQLGASGYVVASEIEEVVDIGLSASPYTVGTIPMLTDRSVDDLAASGRNRVMLRNEIVIPGNIIVVEF